MLHGIFFDLDDTLIDYSEAEHAALLAGCRAAATHYPALEPDALADAIYEAYQMQYAYGTPGFAQLKTLSVSDFRRQLTTEALNVLGVRDADFVETLLTIYAETERETLRPFPDVQETLATLRSYFYLGVITNGPSAMQREKLAAMALDGAFDVIIVDTEFGHPKPDPRIFEYAAAQAECSAEELLFVGNSLEHDVAGAKEAQWTSVWLNTGWILPPRHAPLPDFTIRRLGEVVDLPPVAAAIEQHYRRETR
jgi:HAD superfamily hydrolase (TIGR01549 family)